MKVEEDEEEDWKGIGNAEKVAAAALQRPSYPRGRRGRDSKKGRARDTTRRWWWWWWCAENSRGTVQCTHIHTAVRTMPSFVAWKIVT
jgi:hypothetical protein